jgi:hypothetical protein
MLEDRINLVLALQFLEASSTKNIPMYLNS